jgi:uncharacterized membrane protein (UPF0127 family)
MVRPNANPSNQAAMNILQTMRSTFTSLIFTISSLIVTALLPSTANAEGVPQTQLPRTTLNAGMHLLQVQLAQDFEQRQIGLMWRKEMPQNEGMLFIFEQPAVQCFWMRNTYLPLTAAFVADDGTIVNLADMKPMNDSSHCSNKPVRFVLEMNQGWFAKRNIQAGYKLTGPVFNK